MKNIPSFVIIAYQVYTFENVKLVKYTKLKDGVNMDKFRGAANYIIQLFIKCGQRYSCSRPKLEKLLAISNLAYYVKFENKIFENDTYLRKCGLGFDCDDKLLNGDFVCGDGDFDFSKPICCDNSTEISEKEINPSIDVSDVYKKDVDKLTEDQKNILKAVFLRFGAFGASQLGRLLDDFKENISTELYDGKRIIDYSACKSFFNSCKPDDEKNPIVKFVSSYGK